MRRNFYHPVSWISIVFLLLDQYNLAGADTKSIARNNLRGNDEKELLRQPRIINGSDVDRLRYPYFSLMFGRSLCGGVLIAPNLILGAAHCRGSATQFRIGAFESMMDGQPVRIRDAITHPNYSYGFEYDIMIYVLEKKSNFKPIRLEQKKVKGGKFTVLGFGDTDKGPDLELSGNLQEVELEYVDNDSCDDGHGDRDEVTNDMLCAAGKNKDSCVGDSGGPLIAKGGDADEDTLVGIVSWGRGCAEDGVPGVYVRISYFYDWIVQTVCDNFPEDSPSYMECNPMTDRPMNFPTSSPQVFDFILSPQLDPTATPSFQPSDSATDEVTNYPTRSPSMSPSKTGMPTEKNSGGLNEEHDVTRSPSMSPSMTSLPTEKRSGAPSSEYPEVEFVGWNSLSLLGECQGDCDDDDDCADGLICFQRNIENRLEPIPGCSTQNIASNNLDICILPP